jgi:hypothetical protein
LSTTNGALTGTPTTAATSTFSIQVTADGYMTTESFSLTVNAANTLTITTTSLPNAVAGTDYTQQLSKTGGVGPFTWSISAGTLPAWLTLNPTTGLLTGLAPATLGTSTFTVQVVGSVGTDTQELSLTVAAVGTPPAGGGGDDDDDDNGQVKNFHGLCNAFFQGSEQGRRQKAKSTAFQRLIDAAGATGDWAAAQDKVRTFCDQNNGVLNINQNNQRDGDDDEDEVHSSNNSGQNQNSNQAKNKGKSNGRGRDD